MVTKIPLLDGKDEKDDSFVEKINWAIEEFGGDFVFQWELRGDNHYWVIGNFRNKEDAAFFKLKFGIA